MVTCRARVAFLEQDFPTAGEHHTHAMPGDVGQVVGINGEFLLVTWEPSGTTCDCHLTDLELIS